MLHFEGDLAEITDQQLKYIESVIETLGYTNTKVLVEPVGKAGDNYIANVKRLIIEDGKGGTFKIVAKIAPTNEIMRKMTNTKGMFRNEHIMYTKVLPALTQLEIAADVPPAERLRYGACYGSSENAPNEVILLEDLKESNFIMVDRLKPISKDCVKSVLRNFALLHSLCYALKNKKPELFEEYKNGLFDAWASMENQEQVKLYFKQMETNSINLVDNEFHKKALNGAILNSFKEVVKTANYERNTRYAVIQQGDAWTNNIMFKFDGETLLESIMIDYQASKAISPAADLLYMIFNCTDYQMRKEHFYDWIDYYHDELDKSLSNYGLKANYVFPRDQLDADLKRYGKISFGQSLILVGVLSMKSEEAAQMKKLMETNNPENFTADINVGDNIGSETNALIKTRVEGIIDSFQELGLI